MESYLTISGRGAATALCHSRLLVDNKQVITNRTPAYKGVVIKTFTTNSNIQ